MNNVYSFSLFSSSNSTTGTYILYSISYNDIIYNLNFIYLLQPNGSPSLKLLSVPVNVKKVGYSDL